VVVQFREDKRKSENMKINVFFMIPLLSGKCSKKKPLQGHIKP
jgi:hypothetical protein